MMRIISEMALNEQVAPGSYDIDWHRFDSRGKRRLSKAIRLYFESVNYDAVLFNCGGTDLVLHCLLKQLFRFNKSKVIALEWIGVKPTSIKSHFKALITKAALHRVDVFLLAIKDTSSYEKYFGINTCNSKYIPFKINKLETIEKVVPSEGDYILTCGNRRDYELVKEVAGRLTYPFKMIRPPEGMRKTQGTFLPDADALPSNVEIIQHDGSHSAWLDYIAKCKLLLIPVTDVCVYSEGVSTYLEAMALRKCVITTRFEGTNGIIDGGQAILVPRGDAKALRAAIVEAWEDDGYRSRIADAGHAYAMKLGGEETYHRNVLESIHEFFSDDD